MNKWVLAHQFGWKTYSKLFLVRVAPEEGVAWLTQPPGPEVPRFETPESNLCQEAGSQQKLISAWKIAGSPLSSEKKALRCGVCYCLYFSSWVRWWHPSSFWLSADNVIQCCEFYLVLDQLMLLFKEAFILWSQETVLATIYHGWQNL